MAHSDRLARLVRVQGLLSGAARGLSANEIAGHCEVSRRTAYRDLEALSQARVPLRQENGRWMLDPTYRLRPVNLTLDEAMALYVASRLAHHHADERNRALEGSFEKLAQVLPPAIGNHILATVRMMQMRPANVDFSRAMEVITRGWAERRAVRIWYSRPGDAHSKERLVEPYVIEPSAAGHGTYLIGRDRSVNDVRTFKIERIRAIEATESAFTILGDFAPENYLRNRWGIGYGDETEVALRFTPEVAARVRESEWHPSQQLTTRADGSLEMILRVAGTLEITPWVLSWGPAVEVLKPAELRQAVGAAAHALVRRYMTPPELTASHA